MNRLISNEAVQRLKADAWDEGFYAGQQFGAASERHDPQWDMDLPPLKPENPYRIFTRSQEGGV